MSERPGVTPIPPNTNYGEHAERANSPENRFIKLEPWRDESGEIINIDLYLTGNEGRKEMTGLITRMDATTDIPLFIHDSLQRFPAKQSRILGLLLSGDGQQGLMRHDLLELLHANPAINTAQRRRQVAVHQGDKEMRVLYSYTARTLANVVRYEALMGIYDPDDARWEDRANAIPVHKGHTFEQYHPLRHKGHKQQGTT